MNIRPMKTTLPLPARTLLIAVLFALLLFGCGGRTPEAADRGPQADGGVAGDTGAAPQENGPLPTASAPDVAASENGDGAPDVDDTADGEGPDAGESDEETEAREPAKPTHYMNENYIFKPIDPEGDRKVALLTFDDGPKDEETLGRLLAALDKHEAKAIFFVNGYRVEQNPHLLKKIHDSGHHIGNHAWDHIVLSERSREEVERQIRDVQEIVRRLTGEAPRFFRPPHGAGNDTVREVAREEGLLYMTWSNGSLDWDEDHQTPEAVVRNVLAQLHPGSNILMHELPWTAEALDTLLTRLKEEGYSFLDPARIQTEDTSDSAAASS